MTLQVYAHIDTRKPTEGNCCGFSSGAVPSLDDHDVELPTCVRVTWANDPVLLQRLLEPGEPKHMFACSSAG